MSDVMMRARACPQQTALVSVATQTASSVYTEGATLLRTEGSLANVSSYVIIFALFF